ncbi:uncharacterized protein LOC108915280 [Anoplophora glabripennis]|uniref:uncharacterized protein LOC108915280 n=1 Tax=Anoplophora glabripennis TaxID=217634 RepID=UPI000874C020|nr:uncharacterized protein LOC108915280 [Anoplophora glabripennis]
MSLFRIMWLRRFIRNNTTPIAVDRAALWKKRLSVAYMLITWNAFGMVCYMIYQGKGDWAKFYGVKSEEEANMSPGKQWAKTLGIKNATIYRVSGFEVSREEVDTENEKKQTDNISTLK